MGIIATPLGWIMKGCYFVCKNYGIALLLFTILTRLIVFPLNVKQQKSTARMTMLQPELEKIKKKYAKNQQKMQEEQMNLYAKAGVNPMASCLPMVITMVILFALIPVIYGPLTYVSNADKEELTDSNNMISNLYVVSAEVKSKDTTIEKLIEKFEKDGATEDEAYDKLEKLFTDKDKYPKSAKALSNDNKISNVMDAIKAHNDIDTFILNENYFSTNLIQSRPELMTFVFTEKEGGQYADVLPTLISKRDGRLHTTYNQALTVTGRLSSSNPNLQNIPIRTEEGNKIRAAFCAADKENSLIMSADYSQIELRLLAHVSGDMHLIKAFNSGEDIHAITASKVFGVKLEKVTKEMRRRAKAVNFGIVYGQSKYGLAKNLGITNNEAQEFIDKYFKTYPGVKEYMNEEVEFVNKKGYVETIFGRKRYLSAELNSSTYSIREFAQRAAINQPLQGTAADLIKMAMVKVERELEAKNLKTKMIMQVHDELVFEVPKEELEIVKELVMRCMELKNIPLRVPLVVDVNCGPTWKEV